MAGKLFFCNCPFSADVLPFSMLQQIQIAAPCPVSSETGFFLQPAADINSPPSALQAEKIRRPQVKRCFIPNATKIVAVKIRFGFSQPLLQAVSIVNTTRTIPVVYDFFVSGNESRYSRPTLAYLAGASELYIIIEDILCLQSERPAESVGRSLYEKSSLQAEQNHTYDRQHNPDPLRHRHFFPEQESRQNDREEQDTTVFDSIQHRNVHQ